MIPTRGSIPHATQDWEIRQLAADIIQTYLLSALKRATGVNSSSTIGSSNRYVIIDADVQPIDIPDVGSYKLSDITGTYNPKYLSAWLDLNTAEFKLPQQSKLAFDFTSVLKTPNEPNTWWFSIERPHYYRLQWKIRVGPEQPGKLPPGWTMTVPVTQTISYGTTVQLDYIIERRLDDPSFVVEDYTQWVRELFNNVKSQMSP